MYFYLKFYFIKLSILSLIFSFRLNRFSNLTSEDDNRFYVVETYCGFLKSFTIDENRVVIYNNSTGLFPHSLPRFLRFIKLLFNPCFYSFYNFTKNSGNLYWFVRCIHPWSIRLDSVEQKVIFEYNFKSVPKQSIYSKSNHVFQQIRGF